MSALDVVKSEIRRRAYLLSLLPFTGCVLLFFISSFQPSWAQPGTLPVTSFWSRDIPEYAGGREEEDGLIIRDVLSSAGGKTILLALNNKHASLFFDSSKEGPGTEVPLALTGKVIRLAQGRDDTLWVAGWKNFHFSGRRQWYQSEAYLAKVDRRGRIIWEQAFDAGTERNIQSIRILTSGDAIVAGRDDEKIWLARISQNGSLVWERLFGAAKGVSLELTENEIVVIGFDWAEGASDRAYREDVVAWAFSEAGDLRNRLVIRTDISTGRRSYFGSIRTLQSDNAIYVFSSWSQSRAIKMWEVAKINRSFEVEWRRPAEDAAYRHGPEPVPCQGAVALSEESAPLIVCTTGEEISLWKISPRNGEISKTVSQPGISSICPSGWAPVLFSISQKNSSLEIFGTRPKGVWSASCTWFGQLGTAN